MMKTIAKYGAAYVGGVVTTLVVQKIVRWVRTPAENSGQSSARQAA